MKNNKRKSVDTLCGDQVVPNSTDRHVGKASKANSHNKNEKYLYFVQKVNQVNVDGFEWDLV